MLPLAGFQLRRAFLTSFPSTRLQIRRPSPLSEAPNLLLPILAYSLPLELQKLPPRWLDYLKGTHHLDPQQRTESTATYTQHPPDKTQSLRSLLDGNLWNYGLERIRESLSVLLSYSRRVPSSDETDQTPPRSFVSLFTSFISSNSPPPMQPLDSVSKLPESQDSTTLPDLSQLLSFLLLLSSPRACSPSEELPQRR